MPTCSKNYCGVSSMKNIDNNSDLYLAVYDRFSQFQE